MAAQKKLKTPTIHTRGGQFTTNNPDGVAAAAELDKIEQEYPTIQLGRAQKHDLNNGGKSTRSMFTNYSIFQAESVRLSAEKSRLNIKTKAEANKDLDRIVDVLGVDEVMNRLAKREV